ncbi:MAG: HAD family hydrolase [Candidatus Nanoarchaeia archaeon]|nr:HAD family hydrolase [Candidatus Nanoarchaeia archaeon]
MLIPCLTDKKDLKTLILFALSQKENLSAKEMHFAIKKKGASHTYQAVCKALTGMLEANMLEKQEGKYYKISKSWLNQLESFSEAIHKLKIQEEQAEKETLSKGIKAKSQRRIKVVSFDLDGCLSDNNFDDKFWDNEIPLLVAKDRKIEFEEAYKYVVKEYKRLWGKVSEWRDPDFWLEHFGITASWDKISKDMKHEVKHYGDAIPVIKSLQKDYVLIILSHADSKFLNLKIGIDKLGTYFENTFSTPADFGSMKKDAEVYKNVCRLLGIKPSEMVHVGDDYEHDYAIPASVGIRSFLINRSGKLKEDYVVNNLYDFEERVRELQ